MYLLPSHRGLVARDLPEKLRHMAINLTVIAQKVSLAVAVKMRSEWGASPS